MRLLPHQSHSSTGLIRPVSSAPHRHHECRSRQNRKIGGKLSIMKKDVVGKSSQRRHVLHCLGIFHCPWWETERTDSGKRQRRKWILWTNRRVKHVHKAMVRQALLKIDPPHRHTHTPPGRCVFGFSRSSSTRLLYCVWGQLHRSLALTAHHNSSFVRSKWGKLLCWFLSDTRLDMFLGGRASFRHLGVIWKVHIIF